MLFWTLMPPMRSGHADDLPSHGGYGNGAYYIPPDATSPRVSYANYLAYQAEFDDWLSQHNAADITYSFGFSFTELLGRDWRGIPLYLDPTLKTVLLDSDGDGIPDVMADYFRLERTGPAQALHDPQNTGYTNKERYLAGLDINDANDLSRAWLGDGIPNVWKIKHHLDPLDEDVAWADPDNDGFPNVVEFALGTDPNVSDAPASDTSAANTNSVELDIVIEQNENLYNDAGYLLAVTNRARFDDATDTGPLQGPGGTQPLARVSYSATYLDPTGRLRFSANFGTNGGAVWAYPEIHPVPSALILVAEQRYAPDGGALSWIDPEGVVTVQERDQAGRRVRVVENAEGVAGESRVSGFQYSPDVGLLRLILENPTTGQQVTTWLYGTTLGDNGVARSDLPVRKTYPTAEFESQTYNRQAEVDTMSDANGSTHGYKRDKLGRLIDDQLLVVGSGVDETERRVSTTYDERGRVQYVTTADDPTPGAGGVLCQVKYGYNGIDCMISEAQSHNGAVGVDTPKVQFTCTAAVNNTQRRTAIIYPDGRSIAYEYGSDGSIDDVLNRIQTMHDDATLTQLSEFQYLGATQPAVTTYPA